MTKAVMYWDRLRIDVEGHAGAGEVGQDIVCAAASMLINALAGVLEEAEERGRMQYGFKTEDGKASVYANPNLGYLNEAKAYFRMCVKGFRMLAKEYPKNVDIKEV